MARKHLRTITALWVLLLALTGCGGGGSGGGNSSDTGGGTLVVPARTILPGEIFSVSHPSIQAGQPVDVVLELGGDPVTLRYNADTDGSVWISLPPLIDPDTGELGAGTIRLSLASVDATSSLSVGSLPMLGAGLAPGDATVLLIDAILANYATALDQVSTLGDQAATPPDSAQVLATVAEIVADLEEMRDEIVQTGELTVEMADGSLLTLSGEDLSQFDRWLIASLQGIQTAEDAAAAAAPRVAASLDLSETEIRSLIAAQQRAAGRHTRSGELTEASLNVFLAGTGVPANLFGRFGNALGAMVSTGQLVVALRGSQLTLALTTSALNSDREAQEEWNGLLASLGAFGASLVAVAGAAVTAPAWLGAAGTMATITGLSVAIAGFTTTLDTSVDLALHIPAQGIEFTEVRALQQAGAFAVPSIGVSLEDPVEVSDTYDLHVYAVQGTGATATWHPDLWTALSINRSAARVLYGNSNLGEVNTARGVDGGLPVPAPSLADFSQFGVVATALDFERAENGDPVRTINSHVDVKYVDGAVVFTFEIQEHQDPADQRIDIDMHISNSSSLPLAIYGLQLELLPGVTALAAVGTSTTPLLTVAPNGDLRHSLTDITLVAPTSLVNTQVHPRLLVNNADVRPEAQRFWDGLRSAPALSGLYTVPAPAASDAIVSTFDDPIGDRWGIGAQAPGYASGWFLPQDVGDYRSSGGNPGGYLSWQGDQRDWWFFTTYSSKYSGDRRFAYGQHLSFDLRTEYIWVHDVFFIPFVVLSGTNPTGETLHLYQEQSDHLEPGADWTHYSIPLHESSPWHVSTASSLSSAREATGADILQVLSTLTSLRIRGEYGGYRYRGDLDNVTLGDP